jgi:glucosylglycerate synthase
MPDLEALSPNIKDRLATLNGAELVCVMPAVATASGLRDAAARLHQALDGLAPGAKTVLMHPDGALADGATTSEPDGPALLPFPILPVDQLPPAGQDLADSYRVVFDASHRLGARSCVLVGSDPSSLSSRVLRSLIQPVLEQGFDLITPCYVRQRFQGLLTSSVVAPVTRALYGKRIRFPIGADFAFSARLIERHLQLPIAGRQGIPVWLASDAACTGFKIGQAQLGIPMPAQKDPPDVSAAVAQVLGPLFLDMERNAACWQKVRASQSIPMFGTVGTPPDEAGSGAADVSRMMETFRLGYRNLQDVWSAVLPPATLVELKRLTSLAPTDFRLPDELWARTIYDFALAHRQRVMSRDHLLKAMTPLYLAWVASYATQVEAAVPAAVEQRLERLGTAFEAQKPYLVSRWRWPDRFNP